ncbi:hypothetical protein ABS71_05430 [bacterium SCN 62-11]|nr:MAG: hypothetical protein ABS71_05430 [bacterium SCN 62-11]
MNSSQAEELTPVCWVIGPNVPESSLDHLRSLGIQVEVADEVPDHAHWFVPATLLCSRHFESAVFRRWRPTASFGRIVLPSGRLSHYCKGSWREDTDGRTVSALNHCAFATNPHWPATDPFEAPLNEEVSAPPAIFLLTADWAEADQLLEIAMKADVSEIILASPSIHDLAELTARYSAVATMVSPTRIADQRLPWVSSDPQTLTLSPIDYRNAQAFRNAVGHSIWLRENGLAKQTRRLPVKRKAWGHLQNFHPLQDQTRVGLFFASPKDAELGRELATQRSEMLVFSWDLEAFSKFVVLMNPTALFFDPQLVHFPDQPEISLQENSKLCARINNSLSFSKARLGLLPTQWKATGLDAIFQDLTLPPDKDPSQIQKVFALLQQALSTTEQCSFQFHLDGGWTVEADGATLQWSPSRQLLRLYNRGNTSNVSWNGRIYSEVASDWLHISTHFPRELGEGEFVIAVHQKFEQFDSTPNLIIYSKPVF